MPGNGAPRERTTEGHDPQVWASCIAHDFGNLITLVSCHAELLVRALKSGSQEQRDAIAVRSASRRAKHLLARWLDFYKKAPSRSEPVGLAQFFDEIVSLARPILGARIQITANVEPSDLAVLADREHLERCILNLLFNARDAIVGAGTLSLCARATCFDDSQNENAVAITVTDSGPGIPVDLQERIFEPSFTTKANGHGLGLAMVKTLVTENRGQLAVQNVDESGGACFTLTFPRAQVPGNRLDSERPHSTERTVIMLVEPDPQLGSTLQRFLTGSGYQVLLAPGAGEALLIAERCEAEVECVVMNGPLAWMSCEELGTRLKQSFPDVQTLALAWTPFASKGGIDRVLTKPCHGSMLLRELASMRESRPRKASYTRIKVARPLPAAGNEGG